MAEHIPDEEEISRLVYFPRMYDIENELLWGQVFEFLRGACESVVWKRYAPTDDDLHRIGAEVEYQKKQRRPDVRYVGFITANVGGVRSIVTANGHGFAVMHEPDEGIYHAHICYRTDAGRTLTKNDKNELKFLLRNMFDREVTTR